jgi:hypothetical protein
VGHRFILLPSVLLYRPNVFPGAPENKRCTNKATLGFLYVYPAAPIQPTSTKVRAKRRNSPTILVEFLEYPLVHSPLLPFGSTRAYSLAIVHPK